MLSHILATSEAVSVFVKKLRENEDIINFNWM